MDIEAATRATTNPEVRKMIQRLGAHGLGVHIPHMHPASGGTTGLPADMVQLDLGPRVEFVHRSDPRLITANAIGWRWDEATRNVVPSAYCVTDICDNR